ncbi:hypothetical protein ACLOJK_027728 [Asimina triloba]
MTSSALSDPAGLQGVGDAIILFSATPSSSAGLQASGRWPIVVGRVAGSGPATAIPSFPFPPCPPLPRRSSGPATAHSCIVTVIALLISHPPQISVLQTALRTLQTHHLIHRSKLITDATAPFFSSRCCPARARLLCLTSPATGPPPAALLCLATRQSPPLPCPLCLATRQSPPLPCPLCLTVVGRHQGRRHKPKVWISHI